MFYRPALLSSVAPFSPEDPDLAVGPRANPFASLGLDLPLRMQLSQHRLPWFFSAPFLCGSVMLGEGEPGEGAWTKPGSSHPAITHPARKATRPSPLPQPESQQTWERRDGRRRPDEVPGGSLGRLREEGRAEDTGGAREKVSPVVGAPGTGWVSMLGRRGGRWDPQERPRASAVG